MSIMNRFHVIPLTKKAMCNEMYTFWSLVYVPDQEPLSCNQQSTTCCVDTLTALRLRESDS